MHTIKRVKKIINKWVIEPTPNILAKSLVECISCMIFHFIGSVSPTALTNGVCLMGVVYYAAKVSGAHLNPSVSLTFTLLGFTNPLEMLFYWTAQIIGCCLGALWIAALIPGLHVRRTIDHSGLSGCFIPASVLSHEEIFGWEAICTFTFLVPIFSVVWYTQNKEGYGNTGPVMIGLSLIASALAAGPFTGGALNPARVLGSPMIFNCGTNDVIFYYIIGEIVASFATAIAIIPWYGICDQAWYIMFLPEWFSVLLKKYQPSIQLRTTNTFRHIDI
jgi:glycerol uptake facilitator-like aquaporin